MISACCSALSAVASCLRAASGLSVGGCSSNRMACARGSGFKRRLAYRCLRSSRARSAAPSNCFTLFSHPEIVRDGALKRTKRFADDAFGVIEHTCNLVRSQFLEQYPCRLTKFRVIAGSKVRHEQCFVIAYLALFKVPGGKMPVEKRIACQRAGVQRSRLFEFAVRRGQKGVENLYANIAFAGLGHRVTSVGVHP